MNLSVEVDISNVVLFPGVITIARVSECIKKYCNTNTVAPKHIIAGERIANEIERVFSGTRITVVTERTGPLVTIDLLKEKIIDNYIVLI